MAEWMKRNGVHGYLTQPTEANNGYVGNNEAMRREHPGPRGGGFGRYDQGTSQPLQYMPYPGRMAREPMMSTGGKGKGSQPDSAIADKVRSQRPVASAPAPWASPTPAAPAARPAAVPAPAPVAATPPATPNKPFVKPPVDMRPMYGGAGGRRSIGGGSSGGGGSRRTAGPSAPSGAGQAPIRGQVSGGIEDASRMASFATPNTPTPAARPTNNSPVPNAPMQRGIGSTELGRGTRVPGATAFGNWAGQGFPISDRAQRTALTPQRQQEMRDHPVQAGTRAALMVGATAAAVATSPTWAPAAARAVASNPRAALGTAARAVGWGTARAVVGGIAGEAAGGTSISRDIGEMLGAGASMGNLRRVAGAARGAFRGGTGGIGVRHTGSLPTGPRGGLGSGGASTPATPRPTPMMSGGSANTPPAPISTPARAPAVSTPPVATPAATSTPAPRSTPNVRRPSGSAPTPVASNGLPRGGGSVMANATRAPRLNTGGGGVRLQARSPAPVPGDAARAGSTRRAAGGPPNEVRVEREPEVPFHDFMGGINHGMLSTTDGGGMTRGGTNPPPATTRHGYGLSNVRM